MAWLLENGKTYSFDQLQNGHYEKSIPTDFCNAWLNGKTDFELQTSGSTGIPKRINATRQQLIASANITARFLKLEANQTALVCLDTKYIAGLMMLVRAMEVEMKIVVTPPEANPLQALDPAIHIDFAAFVPYQIEAILKSAQREKLNAIKNVIIGGAPLSEQTKVELQPLTNNVYATYGMTETLTHIALQKLSGMGGHDLFQILPGFSVTQDKRSCLVIQAMHLGADPIVTNDLVELVGTDKFRWLGRIDSVINSGGIKVIPEKLELIITNVFAALKINNRFFVTGIPHQQLGESIALIIEGSVEKNLLDSLRQALSEALPRYENPKSIYCIEKFVYTKTGKINRPETISLIENF